MTKKLLLLFGCMAILLPLVRSQALSVDQIARQKAQHHAARSSCFSSAAVAGSLSPTSVSQTVNATASSMPYWTFSATAGTVYIFSACSSTEDTYIEILQNGTQLSYIDDYGPICSSYSASISWQCPASGTYQVLLAHTGCATLSAAVSFEYYSHVSPQVTSISPTQGTYGDLVSITGTSLDKVNGVNFNGTNTFYTIVNSQLIQAFVPSGATTGKIFLYAIDSIISTNTIVLQSPTDFVINSPSTLIYNFTPVQGPSGTSVTVTGKGFTGASSIQVNGTTATSFSVVNDSTITFTVPSGATTGRITVVKGGTSYSSSADFTVSSCVAPVITVSGAGPYTISATGGVSPYTYSVNGSAYTSSNIINSAQTSNTVLVKDAQGCIGTFTFRTSAAAGCNTQIISGGEGTTYTTHSLGSTAGVVTINYDMYTIPDRMDVYYNGAIVATTGGLVSGQGTLAFYYNAQSGQPQVCTVKMYAPLSGTLWVYTASCPTPCTIVVNQVSLGNNTYQFNVTGGVPPYTFSMDGGANTTSNVFTGLIDSAHSLVITDSRGCTDTHEFNLTAPLNCSGAESSGGQGTSFTEVVFLGYSAGMVYATYNMYSIPDQMDILYNGNVVATTGTVVSGTNTLMFYYPGGGGSCVVRMYAPLSGTAWDYTVSCPAGVGIIDVPQAGKIIFWPNPAANNLTLDQQVTDVEISDLGGQLVKAKNVKDDHTLSIEGLSDGLYFVKAKVDGKEIVQKLSVIK